MKNLKLWGGVERERTTLSHHLIRRRGTAAMSHQKVGIFVVHASSSTSKGVMLLDTVSEMIGFGLSSFLTSGDVDGLKL